jgi:pimeloyl-ACP methyl ester carboxylesterase
MNSDETFHEFFRRLVNLKSSDQPKSLEFCKKFWSLLRPLYVANPADANKLHWDRCDLPTELNLMSYYLRSILPSMQRVTLTPEEIGVVKSPVLTIHGTKDRSAPYGGGREWALMLPNARLLTVEDAAHAPWIESPEQVLWPIETFFEGSWPDRAQKVEAL